MTRSLFHPLIWQWFTQRFSAPTEAQALGWPRIAEGTHTLIAAPTGSGKTLAAFLVCIDRLVRKWVEGTLPDGIEVVYVSPLKALSNDIQRNLQGPLAEIAELATKNGLPPCPIRTGVRTGDTPAAERQAMLKKPPHILVTTPESLYLLLTSPKSREKLRTVKTVIVDEIHALARDKRGSHLTLSLERLSALCDSPPTRIGLSATQKPMEEIAAFLVGRGRITTETQRHGGGEEEGGREPECQIINTGHFRQLDLAVDVPPSELSAVCSNEQWGEVYERLVELIQSHRSTLVFVNTRRLAERIALRLREVLGEEAVAAHHGSLARHIRLDAEQKLKDGKLKAIVATASLEMGIDIGYIDLVCQIGSNRSIANFLQRVGRSGHSLGALPKGRLFPLTRDELIEGLAMIRAVREGNLDRIEIPQSPLDILAQQIVAAVSCEEWGETELYDLCRRAYPYRNLSRQDYSDIIKMLTEGVKAGNKAGVYLHRDQINGKLKAKRHARMAAIMSGGAIPEQAQYNVVVEGERTVVGTVDEDFAIESLRGDVFLLGNTSWMVRQVTGGEVIVIDAGGAPPTIPFWLGEAPGRTVELSGELSRLRRDISEGIESWVGFQPAQNERQGDAGQARSLPHDAIAWLQTDCGACPWAAEQAVRYIAAQKAAIGRVPTREEIVFERFFDESGGMQLVIHSPLGSRINKAWGLALRKRFCRSFDFELQAAADENGVLLSIGPQHSFAIESLFPMIGPHNGQHLLEQALLAVPMFGVRWRWNITRALAVLRMKNGKKVPPFLQKFRSEDLLAQTFPETVGCLENHHGDIQIPDHPIVRQTMHDCLTEAMDLPRWLAMLQDVKDGKVKFFPIDTREPSPFSHQILNANPYSFLDDAPLEERRTRAVTTRRSLSVEDFRDLAKLDPEAIAQVSQDAWPLIRDADELHDALLSLIVVFSDESAEWNSYFQELVKTGRAAEVTLASGKRGWIAAERWLLVQAVYPGIIAKPVPQLPPALQKEWEPAVGRLELVRGRILTSGPTTAANIAKRLLLEESQVEASLESLEGSGVVMRGRFTAAVQSNGEDKSLTEWCERRLLARIHRLTLDGLRQKIQPVAPEVYLDYLTRQHGLHPASQKQGEAGLREVLLKLQGFELSAGVWEEKVLSARVAEYDPQWLDMLFMSGEAMWGRLRPPIRDEKDGPGMAALNRTMPIALLMRDDLAWLLPRERVKVDAFAGGKAQDVLGVLSARGALFYQELKGLTGLLPTELEDALRELAALGLVSSDTFAAVRYISKGAKKTVSRRLWPRKKALHSGTSPVGRWSRFPGETQPPENDEYLQRWCKQLLSRYGVVFRDCLTRENAAPPWFELVRVFRRMELRGEVRGGRFIARVAGEQFAQEAAVSQLRTLRDAPNDGQWSLLSAADPVNLSGIITDGPRIAAMHKNSLILQDGRCVAAKVAGRIEFFAEIEPVASMSCKCWSPITPSSAKNWKLMSLSQYARP
ncbi:MAG: DEAD/DEAH box helicase [Planctomycetales bacterium]|nr:DEAD/DEAH box helicase [Planctomycetales bacterium]